MEPFDVAVVTATSGRADRMSWMADLHESICGNALNWQWCVAVDGADVKQVPVQIRDDERVTIDVLPRRSGAAAARNVALHHVQAPWVTSADDDDLLPPGSLDVRFESARNNPDVGWVAGLLTDLFDDGSSEVWDCPTPRGYREPGDVWRAWPDPEAVVPLGPTSLMVRTDLLRSVGGWQGLSQGEDLGMTMAVTSNAPGFMLDKAVYMYRKHAGQMMQERGFSDMESIVRSIAWHRGRLLCAHSGFRAQHARWALS